jgi:hypothetical protein
MATLDQIPSDLTLEIGADISPEKFLTATRAFFGYVDEIGKTVVGDDERPNWVVRVRSGSSLIGVDPTPMTSPAIVQAIYARAAKGANALSEGDIDASDLPERALTHLRTLSDVLPLSGVGSTPMRIWVKKQPIALSREMGDLIKEMQRSDYRDYGTVEGRLEAIQDHRGLELRIRDSLLKLTVRCTVPEEKLEEVFRHFRKRVELSGLVHFRRNGIPISIDVSGIQGLPDDADLPDLEEVRGIMRASA